MSSQSSESESRHKKSSKISSDSKKTKKHKKVKDVVPNYNPGEFYNYENQYLQSMLAQPIVQNFALQYGQKFANQGRELVGNQYELVTTLKYYFAVDNDYVINKLHRILSPFSYNDWATKFDEDCLIQPRFDINVPDLYIPTMAFLTYIVLAGVIQGIQGSFSPEHLGMMASSALAYNIFELIIYILAIYLANIRTSLTNLDLIAFSGYKYVIIVAILVASILLGKSGYYIGFFYCSFAIIVFLLHTLKTKVMTDKSVLKEQQLQYEHEIGRKRKLYFLFLFCGLQPILSFWFTSHLIQKSIR